MDVTVDAAEITEPSVCPAIRVADDVRQRFTRVAGSGGANGITCPSETFVSDQAQDAQSAVTVVVAFELVAEEVEPPAGLIQIDDPSLGRMQREAGVCRPVLHVGQGAIRFLCRVTEDHVSSDN